MSQGRRYPDESVGDFEAPPIEFRDGEDREIEVLTGDDEDREALVGMYSAFDSADRAQGIPPTGEQQIRDWLDRLFEDGLHVIAWDGEKAAGHATMVPDDQEGYELAIFVLQEYQGAGIGRKLMEGLLGYGQREGVECVWLTVERWNHAAINLYESIGFETCHHERFERDMSIRLAPPEDE